jgi:hypothetical protein
VASTLRSARDIEIRRRQLISGLEELGYVERRPDPSDGRAKSVHYTAKALQMLADAREIGEEIDADVIATIGTCKYALLSRLLAEAVEVRHLPDGLSPPNHICRRHP